MRLNLGKNRGNRQGKPKQPRGMGKPKKGKGLGKGKKGGKGKKRPVDPTAPLTGKQFNQEVTRDTNRQIRPLANQIRSERAGSLVRQNQEIPAWFADYQQKVSGAQAATAGAYQQAGAQWGDYLKQADTQDTAARNTVNQQAQADAAYRGANVSTLASDQAQNAAARRTDLGAVGGGTIATQGANAYAYLQDKQRIGAREEVDQRLQEGKRRSKIDTDLRELMREKGELRSSIRGEKRKEEREYRIQNKAFASKTGYNKALNKQSKLGLKGEKVSAAAQQNVAGTYAGAKLGAAQTNLQGIKAQNKGGVKKQKLKNKGIKSLPSGGGATKGEMQDATHTVRNLFGAAKKPPKTSSEWKAFAVLVANEGNVSPTAATKAVKKFRNKKKPKPMKPAYYGDGR